MATLYSTAVPSGGPIGSSTRSPAHARTRTTLTHFTGAPATTDVVVLGYVKSSDQIIDIEFATDGGGTAGSLDIGLSSVNFANNDTELTVVDVDLYAATLATGTPILFKDRVDAFEQATTLTAVYRGASAWAQAAAGAASYTSDPGLTFAITATPDVTVDASNVMSFLITYVAGD